MARKAVQFLFFFLGRTGHGWAPRPAAVHLQSPWASRLPRSAAGPESLEEMSHEELLRHIAVNGREITEVGPDGKYGYELLPEVDSAAEDEAEAEAARERGATPGSAVLGDMNGLDDPRDVYWRVKGEEVIRAAVAAAVPGVQVYDVSWNVADLQVLLEPSSSSASAVEVVGIDEIVAANQAIQDALDPLEEELDILGRHELEVSTRGAPNELTADREFAAFKGFDVVVAIKDLNAENIEPRPPVVGKLVGRDVHEVTVSVKGRNVRVPNYLVASVTLPDALEEPKDGGKTTAAPKKPTKAKKAKK